MKKYKIISFFVLVCLYFITRLQNLTTLPVFADEAIYIRWSQVMKAVETLRFLPLTDGKQPLFMWLTIPLFKLISDPLAAGRLVSVFSGLLCMICIGLIATLVVSTKQKSIEQELKNILFHPLSYISMLIYISLPFTFFFDRVAVPDNLLSSLLTLSILLVILFNRHPRLDLAFLLGATFGLAWLTKSPAAIILIISVLWLNINHKNLKVLSLTGISTLITFTIYNTLRLGPQFHMIAARNLDYIHPIGEILSHPLDPFLSHFGATQNIYYFYVGFFIFLLLGFLKSKLTSEKIFIIILWIFPTIMVLSTAKVFTSRYILFTIPPLIVLLSLSLHSLLLDQKLKLFATLLFIVSLTTSTIYIARLSKDPYHLTLPQNDSGYTRDWTSGWGIKKAADYILSQNPDTGVLVATEGTFGTLPDGLQIYLNQYPKITVLGLGKLDSIPESLKLSKSTGNTVYMLGNRSRINPTILQFVNIVQDTPKPDGDSLLLMKI